MSAEAVPYVACAAAAGAAAAAVWGALRVHTRLRGWLPEDHPAPGRKRHERPTPMVGLLPATGSVVACLVWGVPPALTAAIALAGGVGWVDDLRKDRGGAGLSARTKALVLTAAAVAATAAAAPPSAAACALAIGAVFVGINAVNFLDNLDGVAILLGATGLLALCAGGAPDGALAAVLAALWLGVLPFNWPRPQVFLGDSGALALGAVLAALALRTAWPPAGPPTFEARPWLAVGVFAVPLLDFAQVISARLWLGYAPWVGDRRHLTHLLATTCGVPRRLVAPLLALAAAGLGVVAGLC